MAEFEKWYNKQYPLPSTIERGPIGRDAKEQARSAWKAAISAENKALTTAEGEVKQLRALKCPPISDGDTCICPIEELEDEVERYENILLWLLKGPRTNEEIKQHPKYLEWRKDVDMGLKKDFDYWLTEQALKEKP